MAFKSTTNITKGSVAKALTLTLALSFSALQVVLAPVAQAVDVDDVKVNGHTIVGSALTVEEAHRYFEGCSGTWKPSHTIQWFRDGVPVEISPVLNQYIYKLSRTDLGSRISAVVTASPVNCPGQSVRTDESDVVRKQPMRAEGFTGRGTFELLARRHDGAMMLYLGQDNVQGWKEARLVGPGWGAFTNIVALGDVGSDGANDLLVTESNGMLYRFDGHGDGGINVHPWNIGWGWNAFDQVIGPGDFDGDGRNDVLAGEPSGDLYLYSSREVVHFNPGIKVGRGWNVMDVLITPGDFNGDGAVDVLAKDKEGRLFLYGGNGRGGWLAPRLVGQGWNVLSKIGSAGDFNRDGFNDVHGVNSAGELLMYYGDGRGGWKGVETVGWGWNIFNALY